MGRKESSVNGPLKRFGRLMRRWQCIAQEIFTGRLSIAQEIFRKSTDFLRRWEGVTLSYVARIATASHWMTTFGGYPRDKGTATTERRSTAAGGAQLVEASTNGERPTGYWWCSSVSMPNEAKVFEGARSAFGAV